MTTDVHRYFIFMQIAKDYILISLVQVGLSYYGISADLALSMGVFKN